MQMKTEMTAESLGARISLVLQLTVSLMTDSVTQHTHDIRTLEPGEVFELSLGVMELNCGSRNDSTAEQRASYYTNSFKENL